MTSLSSIITDAERRAMGTVLRGAGYGEAADVIDKLVKFATDEIYLVDEVDRALRNYVVADQRMHTTYGSTGACYGGVGGQAMTPHCAHICGNVSAHANDEQSYRDAFIAAKEAVEKVRNV